MFHNIGQNDVVLIMSLSYMCYDFYQEWDNFSTCSKPIHQWLITSCVCAICFRLMRILVTVLSAAPDSTRLTGSRQIGGQIGEYLLDVGHKGSMQQALTTFTWRVAVPFFAVWNFLGTYWFYKVMQETPTCLPTTTHLWFSGLWLVLCYLWLFVHLGLASKAWKLDRQVQRTEDNLREMEDEETVQRWGRVSNVSGSRALVDATMNGQGGLSPDIIKSLPCETAAENLLNLGPTDCPICLSDVVPGECVRCLPKCGHIFHRSCIDLWLVRRADCPLCKQDVVDKSK